MKKAFLTLVVIVAVLCFVGCSPQELESKAESGKGASAAQKALLAESGPSATDMLPDAAFPQLETLANDSGRCLVSDGGHLFFTGDNKLFRTNLDLSEAIVLDDLGANHVNALCLADGKVYYSTSRNIGNKTDFDDSAYEIRCVDIDGQDIQVVDTSESEVFSLWMQQGKLVYPNGYCLVFAEPNRDGEADSVTLDGVYTHCAAPCDDDTYFTCSEWNHSNPRLCVIRGTNPDSAIDVVADSVREDTLAVSDADVYFLVQREGDGESGESNSWELMKADEQGNVLPCDVTGTSRDGSQQERLCACGGYLFYSKYEVAENAQQGEWMPYYYDTVNGNEMPIPGIESGNDLMMLFDVAGGYAFFREDGHGESRESWLYSLTDPGKREALESIVERADNSPALARIAQEKAQAQEAADEEAAAKAEGYANEPYGPGTSELLITADELSACCRLVRMDDTTEFTVLLSPGESTVRDFPSGRYYMKIAQGETWISDEEAFGDDGYYTESEVFTFEEGATYELTVYEMEDYHEDDKTGFLN